MILNGLIENEEVSLYQRKFLGINKEYDKNFVLTKEYFDMFHDSEKSERTLIIIEGFFFTIPGFIFLFIFIAFLIGDKE